MAQYNHAAIEKKWRENWEKNPINVNDGKKEKYYCLDMFPYPSGSGLHVGHWRGYVISDVWSRYQLLKGKYVIHPMGWDAFGLPAENYAIKMGVHPAKSTAANVANIKRQIGEIAAIYDWDMEVNTTDPAFYKWTQWIFVQMFKKGLAYEKEFPINWCPSCKTGLANEEVVTVSCISTQFFTLAPLATFTPRKRTQFSTSPSMTQPSATSTFFAFAPLM